MIENFVSDNSDLKRELKQKEFDGKQQQLPLPLHPKLAASVNSYEDKIIFSQEDRNIAFGIKGSSRERLKRILLMMDGTNSLTKLQQMFSPNNPQALNTVVRYLDENKLLDDASHIQLESSLNTLLELETFINKLLKNQIARNNFFLAKPDSVDLQMNYIYGFAIEMYHYFTRKADIDSSALNFSGSTKIRLLINQLYCREYSQDQFLLEALNYIGISHEDLMDTMALPQTMGICNSLAYWANFDSLFYFSILGVLANQNIKNLRSYLHICEELKVDSGFLNPIRKLISSQQNNQAKNITHQIFEEIYCLDEQTKQRLKAQMYIFTEIYTNFYNAIFDYYSHPNSLLRRVSAI